MKVGRCRKKYVNVISELRSSRWEKRVQYIPWERIWVVCRIAQSMVIRYRKVRVCSHGTMVFSKMTLHSKLSWNFLINKVDDLWWHAVFLKDLHRLSDVRCLTPFENQ